MNHMTFRALATLNVLAVTATAAPASPAPTVQETQMPVIVNMAADGVVNFVLHNFLREGTNRAVALAALDKEVDQYQGIGVSHLFWNVNYQRVGYDSAVWPSYWDVPDPGKQVTEWPRTYYLLHTLGIDDVFSRLIPRTREKGLSPWVSLRMNDHHYHSDFSRVSPLLFNHPELRLHNGRGLFNYACPEVREHYMSLLTEVLKRYDIDGVELDWIRTPDNFEASELDRGRGILTDFVREARRQTQAASQRLGHPVRLAVRVPATPEFAYGKGFDTVVWAKTGLVDMIIPSDWWSGFHSGIPIEVWRQQLGEEGKGCQIVPCSASTYSCMPKGPQMNHSLPAMRGFAASMYDRGADGIYLFNHFAAVTGLIRHRTPEGKSVVEGTLAELLCSAGDRTGAFTRPRVHALTLHDCVPAKTDYRPVFPAALTRDQPLSLRLHTGPKPAAGRCELRVALAEAEGLSSARVEVCVSGVSCPPLPDFPPAVKRPKDPNTPRQHVCEIGQRVLRFDVPVSSLARGENMIVLTMNTDAPQTATWLEMAIDPSADAGALAEIP